MNTKLAGLIDGRKIWLGNQQQLVDDFCSTSYLLLDEKLGGGWPQYGVIELQTANGIGELRLLAPFLSAMTTTQQLIMFINAPSIINSQMLAFNDIEPSAAVMINTNDDSQQLWSAEQSLHSGCVSTVVLWQQQFSSCQIKRLKLAAKAGGSRLIVIRPPNQLNALPVNLTLALMPSDNGLDITIKKQQGHWPQPMFTLDMSQQWPDLVTHRTYDNVITLAKRRVS